MSSVLVVKDLSKSFFKYRRGLDRLANWFGISKAPLYAKNILRDISFSVDYGEVVGVIGGNGAGKSSLLKIITGTMCPTKGSVITRGSVSSILELGMGFHPELSGRQNAINTAKLMGRSSGEVDKVISNIENFANIGANFDYPVRMYSSGMQVRVAFAVATAFRPDLLIIDEALSVGDVFFQRKCFRKIEEFKKKGTSILLVSHDIETIKRICSRAIFIKDGALSYIGKTKTACDLYEKDALSDNAPENPAFLDSGLYQVCGAEITSYWLSDSRGSGQITKAKTGGELMFCYEVLALQEIKLPVFNMQIKTKDGLIVNGVNSDFLKTQTSSIAKGSSVRVCFSFQNHLAPNYYYFSCGVKDNNEKFLHRLVDCCTLNVSQKSDPKVAVGLVDLDSSISIEVL